MISRVPVIVADILLICTIWTNLRAQWGTLGDLRKSKRLSLSDVFFRGGKHLPHWCTCLKNVVAY